MGQGIGHPIIGLSTDRWGRFNITSMCTLLAGLAALLLWVFAGKSFAGLIVYALCGALAGCIWPTVAAVGAEVVGLPLLPSGTTKSPQITSSSLTPRQPYLSFGRSWLFRLYVLSLSPSLSRGVVKMPTLEFSSLLGLRLSRRSLLVSIFLKLESVSTWALTIVPVWLLRARKMQEITSEEASASTSMTRSAQLGEKSTTASVSILQRLTSVRCIV